MLSEELSRQAISVTFEATELTLSVLERIINDLASRNTQKPKTITGEQSFKELYAKDAPLEEVPVLPEDLKGIRKELRSKGVDFAIYPFKTKSEDGEKQKNFKLYFKGRDVPFIDEVLKNYIGQKMQQEDKSQQPENKKSVKEKMNEAKEKAAAQHTAERDKSKSKERESR